MKTYAGIAGTGVMLLSVGAFAGGTVAGTISFSGAAPKMDKLDRKADAFCAATDVVDPTVTVSKDGKALANVVVRIKEGPPAATAPADPVTIDQKGCMYSPRVQGAITGQKVQVRNSDGTLHNVHAYNGAKTLFNQAQPPDSKPLVKDLKKTELLTLKCDVHAWMAAYVVLNPNQFFATTGADGSFQIKGVPPGKYKIEAWHEKFGAQTAEVTVEEGKSVDPKLGFKG